MKRFIHNTLLLLAVFFSILSCSDKGEEVAPPQIDAIATETGSMLNGASVLLAGDGEQYSFGVRSNTAWTIGCQAEWVHFSSTVGQGNKEITLAADATDKSRSAVAIIYAQAAPQIKLSFNIIQHANTEIQPEERPENNPEQQPEDNPEQQPEDNPEQQPEDNPEQQPEDTPEQQPEDTPEQQPEDTPEQQPEDNPEQQPEDNPEQQPENNPEQQPEDNPEQQPEDTPEQQPEDNPEQQPEDNPEQQPEDNPEQQPEDDPDENVKPGNPTNSYSEITNTTNLQPGIYFLGGYQNSILHLAVADISDGHLHTTSYVYNPADKTLSPTSSDSAIEVRLEAASGTNAYYINFVSRGYLIATAGNAGSLEFTSTPDHAWIFSTADGGFEVKQQGDIDVKLIVSRRAPDRVIRSIAGDEDDGNPIILFRKD